MIKTKYNTETHLNEVTQYIFFNMVTTPSSSLLPMSTTRPGCKNDQREIMLQPAACSAAVCCGACPLPHTQKDYTTHAHNTHNTHNTRTHHTHHTMLAAAYLELPRAPAQPHCAWDCALRTAAVRAHCGTEQFQSRQCLPPPFDL